MEKSLFELVTIGWKNYSYLCTERAVCFLNSRQDLEYFGLHNRVGHESDDGVLIQFEFYSYLGLQNGICSFGLSTTQDPNGFFVKKAHPFLKYETHFSALEISVSSSLFSTFKGRINYPMSGLDLRPFDGQPEAVEDLTSGPWLGHELHGDCSPCREH
jgi:hypothetical protein